mmetsp:Transcript_28281/g.74195  ORF Transcript_28281/g.74195 Transcript_28281/m.74195 type:complete len:556 (-) Transcript_28281:65-1732(-)
MYEEPSTVSKEALYSTLTKRISKEVPRDSIDCGGGRLGEGQFGEVFRGSYTGGPLGKRVPAAVKMCKPSAGNQELVEFLREAAIMGQFDHPHIIQIFGYVTANNPPMIAIELADCALQDRLHKKKCSSAALIGWAHELSTAMCYLATRGFIHRDLAVRNVLLVGDVAKLSDFGRSRRLAAVDDIYAAGNAALVPVRWTAPEALAKGMYSSASDVWSFGVMLYEMWTRGAMPYEATLTNAQVFEKLERGWRLGPPRGCPKSVYTLMLDCWHPEPASRPPFPDVEKAVRTVRHSKPALSNTYRGEPEAEQFRYMPDDRAPATGVSPPTSRPASAPAGGGRRPSPSVQEKEMPVVRRRRSPLAREAPQICYTPDEDLRDTREEVGGPSVTDSYAVPFKPRPGKSAAASPPEYADPVDTVAEISMLESGAANISLSDDDDDEYVLVKDTGGGGGAPAAQPAGASPMQLAVPGAAGPAIAAADDTDADGVTEHHALEKTRLKVMAGAAMAPPSAKLAKRTSKWVSEWNDRTGSERPSGMSTTNPPGTKSRGFFRSKLKPR